MQPNEVFFQISPGRKQVSDSTQAVCVSGYSEKTVSKFAGEVKISNTFSVCNHDGEIIQVYYGKLNIIY